MIFLQVKFNEDVKAALDASLMVLNNIFVHSLTLFHEIWPSKFVLNGLVIKWVLVPGYVIQNMDASRNGQLWATSGYRNEVMFTWLVFSLLGYKDLIGLSI
ncbi:hypothetical protein CEXT_780811 [Caerostris extrusa]|uniref:Uncharacterized protein n=1 Tax=Caerostris extrusa TaxID=172846 RepID=A0AAV4XBE5_CAEEX|nr:hypothetical protein CEXT_780811 [Caerostris extrusa]